MAMLSKHTSYAPSEERLTSLVVVMYLKYLPSEGTGSSSVICHDEVDAASLAMALQANSAPRGMKMAL